jgi:hypothetical protein
MAGMDGANQLLIEDRKQRRTWGMLRIQPPFSRYALLRIRGQQRPITDGRMYDNHKTNKEGQK